MCLAEGWGSAGGGGGGDRRGGLTAPTAHKIVGERDLIISILSGSSEEKGRKPRH